MTNSALILPYNGSELSETEFDEKKVFIRCYFQFPLLSLLLSILVPYVATTSQTKLLDAGDFFVLGTESFETFWAFDFENLPVNRAYLVVGKL